MGTQPRALDRELIVEELETLITSLLVGTQPRASDRELIVEELETLITSLLVGTQPRASDWELPGGEAHEKAAVSKVSR